MTALGVMEKGSSVKIIEVPFEEKRVHSDRPVEYFLLTVIRSTF